MSQALTDALQARLAAGENLWLFLDYDGTLAEFAPTPDVVLPDPELIELVGRLAAAPRGRVTILSGRRLDHIRDLLPVPGVILAGTYGLEIQHPGAGPVPRADAGVVRPVLDEIGRLWSDLIRGRPGFYLEDKGLALALHASRADGPAAEQVLAAAQQALAPALSRPEIFRVLGGYKFLEVGPAQAGKGAAIEYLFNRYPFPGAFPVFLGDDDKDEDGFQVVRQRGGLAVLVAAQPRPSLAEFRLEHPAQVRAWLAGLADLLERPAG
jgi:trehalose 6-phosphate phosphatase